MKPNVVPRNEELLMREGEFIVSKTDLKGQITYANRVFLEFAGYTEDILIGAPHNIIRHPEMPKGVFKLLWDTIQTGSELFAYVKNISSSGAYYWAFANVTPVKDGNNAVVGYCSVRRKPSAKAIEVMSPLYKEMVQIEQSKRHNEALPDSVAYLENYLKERNVSYEEYILSI
jgi:PAS domain S-box-containing protein